MTLDNLDSLVFLVVRLSAAIAAWLATYAVHSTIVIGIALVLAWLTRRGRGVRDHALRDILWKSALVGALLTATLQSAAGWSPLGAERDVSGWVESMVWASLPAALPLESSATHASYASRLASPAGTARFIPVVLVLAWLAYALVVVRRLLLATRRARAALGPRRVLRHAAVRSAFEELVARMGIRRPVELTVIDHATSPVVIGRTEVCLPAFAIDDLAPEEQRSILAHEIAHLVRRDPAWLLAATSAESLFFFQPLNRVVRRGLMDDAEFLADEMAARHGGALPLARGLARVAEWMPQVALRRTAPLPALMESSAMLVRRVERLTTPGDRPETRGSTVRRALVAALPVCVAAACAPLVTASSVRAWGTPAFQWEGVMNAGQAVEVIGVLGAIRAEPGEGASVVVNATRHGHAPDPDVQFSVVRHAAGVTICALYPVPAGRAPNACRPGATGPSLNVKANDVEIDFLVRLPRGVGFAAHNLVGDVNVVTSSWATASSAAGNVTVRMAGGWRDTLRVSSLSGNVRVVLPDTVHADVVADTRTGRVRSDFGGVLVPPQGFWSRFRLRGSLGRQITGRLGSGGAPLILSSLAGDITIQRAAPAP